MVEVARTRANFDTDFLGGGIEESEGRPKRQKVLM